MKRSLLFLGISLVLGVGFVILTTQPAEAVRTYRDADLSGSYYFVNMEIRQEWVEGVLVDGMGIVEDIGVVEEGIFVIGNP